MIVAGIMSGTSADGIDVAVARISCRGRNLRLRLLAHRHYRFPTSVRNKLLAILNSKTATLAELGRMNFLLGELYAEAVIHTRRATGLVPALIGCHGQTLYHQGRAARFLGRDIAVTWQTGEAAVIAARTRLPVVSDFRPADLAAGGQGAPLVPLLDYVLFRHRARGRILQNIGGISNLTAIAAGATQQDILAFDTGPGNMVIDALAGRLFNQPFDRDGKLAARGSVLDDVLKRILRQPFFRRPPPRTAGREQFGAGFVENFIRYAKKSENVPVKKEDLLATATALTAASIAAGVKDFVLPGSKYHDYIVSGGGAKNRTLMKMLAQQILPLGLKLQRSEDFGLPAQAKEAAAFALLAYQTWNRRPGNLPSATGAWRPAILGKICFP